MRDDGPVVWFDGECVLCNGFVDFLLRWDRARRIRYGTLQSARGQELCRRHEIEIDPPGSIIVTDGERVYFRSDGILHVWHALGGIWKYTAALRFIPRFLRDGIYNWIARRRYRIFGKQACRISKPEERERFIEDA